MAETIEYTSLVKFIKEEIIEERIANGYRGLIGGGENVNADVDDEYRAPFSGEEIPESPRSKPSSSDNVVKRIYRYVSQKFSGLESLEIIKGWKDDVVEMFDFQEYLSVELEIILMTIIIAALVYVNTKNNDEKQANAVTVLGIGLSCFGFYYSTMKWDSVKDLFNKFKLKVKSVASDIKGKITSSNSNESQASSKLMPSNQASSKASNSSIFGSRSRSGSSSNLGGGSMALAVTVLGSIAVILGLVKTSTLIYEWWTAGNTSKNNANFEQMIKQKLQLGSSYSRESAGFYFDTNSGELKFSGNKTLNEITLTSSKHFGVTEIKMKVNAGKVSFKVNGIELDSISYIQNRPVQTALVMAYLVKDKHFSRLTSSSASGPVGESTDYKFNFEEDGTLRLTKKQADGSFKEVESVSMAIRQQMSGDEASASKTMVETCKKMFGVSDGLKNTNCAKHFYSILGKSAISMLKNMGEVAAKSTTISEALKDSDVNIKYEILKNLDWKMKISNGKKEMVDVDQWLYRLSEDSRQSIQQLAQEYKLYLNAQGAQVKEILNHMVNHINTNSRLLDEKYKEAIQQQPQNVVKKRRNRLTAAQVANLRAQNINENSLLNTPFVMPGVPGAYLYPQVPSQMIGGSHTNYKQSFESIKQALASYNQKLSSDTERKMEEKIRKIESLENELYTIHQNINKYTQILRSDKNPELHGRVVSLEHIENLIAQYQQNSKEQTKQIVTLTTAFGKVKMLLEKEDKNTSKINNVYDL